MHRLVAIFGERYNHWFAKVAFSFSCSALDFNNAKQGLGKLCLGRSSQWNFGCLIFWPKATASLAFPPESARDSAASSTNLPSNSPHFTGRPPCKLSPLDFRSRVRRHWTRRPWQSGWSSSLPWMMSDAIWTLSCWISSVAGRIPWRTGTPENSKKNWNIEI